MSPRSSKVSLHLGGGHPNLVIHRLILVLRHNAQAPTLGSPAESAIQSTLPTPRLKTPIGTAEGESGHLCLQQPAISLTSPKALQVIFRGERKEKDSRREIVMTGHVGNLEEAVQVRRSTTDEVAGMSGVRSMMAQQLIADLYLWLPSG